MNTQIFTEKANIVHSFKYDYSLVNYEKSRIKIKIICPEHGMFEQEPVMHVSKKQGCPKCAGTERMTREIFIKKANKVHDSIYDYSLVDYKNNKTKIKVICKEHGVFETRPDNHLNKKSGCSKCANNILYTKENFVNKCNSLHNNKYDYSLVEYKTAHYKIKIICPKHGVFEQMAKSHSRGVGCPFCSESKGEILLSKFLETLSIKYVREKIFETCKYKNYLPFDFYLPDMNICIEYDGSQHYEPFEHFGGENGFEERKIKDQIKTNYCKDNNIKLIRIRYDDNINQDKFEILLERKNSE